MCFFKGREGVCGWADWLTTGLSMFCLWGGFFLMGGGEVEFVFWLGLMPPSFITKSGKNNFVNFKIFIGWFVKYW